MARILLTVWPFPTHLPPFISVANALRKRGHEVGIYTDEAGIYTGASPASQACISQFTVFPFRQVDWQSVVASVDRLIAGGGRAQTKYWQEFLVRSLPGQISDIGDICRQWSPECIICDIAMWGPIVFLSEQTSIPVVPLSHVAACILPGPEGPVPGFAMPPPRSVFGRLKANLLERAVYLATMPVRRQVNRLRSTHGMPSMAGSVTEQTARMPLYFVPNVREFDRMRTDLPSTVHYVGPCLWPPLQPSPPSRAGAEDVILVEEGGLYTEEPILLNIACRGLGGAKFRVRLFPASADRARRVQLNQAPENIELCSGSFADHLASASMVVTTGNSDSVLTVLSSGVPLVVQPGLWDQAELAWRVEETGVGLRIPPRERNPAVLRHAVDRVLSEGTFRRKARGLQKILSRHPGPETAALLVEELLDKTQRPAAGAVQA